MHCACNMILSFGFRRDLARWQHLVSPYWVACLTAGKQVTAAPARHWRLLEIGFNAKKAYLQGHIPGASYVDTTEFEQGPVWNKVADPILINRLLSRGIRHDTTVIVYARDPLAAARAAHLMLYAGVEDVRLLDGGYAAWTRLRFRLEQGLAASVPAACDFGCHYPAHPEYLVNMGQVKILLGQSDACLVSLRMWNEFIGKTSGHLE
jgi:3-mercaptopyruvate sulfurtransferase SseA